MNVNSLLGILCAVAFLIPALIILSSRLLINISLVSLVVYFLLVTTWTLMAEKVIIVDREGQRNLGIISNYLDVPLMLTSMLMFCTEKTKKRFIITIIIAFSIYEPIILFQYQLSSLSSKYIMGPGIILVLLFSLYFFINNIKNTI